MYRFALPVETKVRELNGKLWLAVHMALRGYEVIIGELTNLKKNLDCIKPQIYMGDSAVYKKSRLELYKQLKKADVAVAVHDTEGGLIYSPEYYKGRLSNKVLRYVDCFLAWGEETSGIFNETCDNNSVINITVGNPGFDLLYKKNRPFFRAEQERISSRFGNFVLINTHFGFYNHYNRDKYINPIKEKFPGLFEFKKQLFNHFVDAIMILSKTNDNINFVIRPHPSENFKKYKEIFKSKANVFIKHENSVHPWALAASLIIHNGCTTGVESALLGRPVVSFRPVTNETWDVDLPHFVSKKASNIKELQSYLDTYCLSDNDTSIELDNYHKKEIEKILSPIDGKSAERICDAFEHLKIYDKTQINFSHRKKINKTLKEFFRKVTVRDKIGADSREVDGYSEQKFSEISLHELNLLLLRIQELNSEFQEVEIYEFEEVNNIFLVKNRNN